MTTWKDHSVGQHEFGKWLKQIYAEIRSLREDVDELKRKMNELPK